MPGDPPIFVSSPRTIPEQRSPGDARLLILERLNADQPCVVVWEWRLRAAELRLRAVWIDLCGLVAPLR